MDITAQDAFKLGFLARCAEERLTGAALDSRIEKVAEVTKQALLTASDIDVTKSLPNLLYNGAVKPFTGFARMMYALPFAASATVGAGLGYGAAKMVEPQISDDEIKAQELADTYRLYAEKARSRKKTRQYRLGHNQS